MYNAILRSLCIFVLASILVTSLLLVIAIFKSVTLMKMSRVLIRHMQVGGIVERCPFFVHAWRRLPFSFSNCAWAWLPTTAHSRLLDLDARQQKLAHSVSGAGRSLCKHRFEPNFHCLSCLERVMGAFIVIAHSFQSRRPHCALSVFLPPSTDKACLYRSQLTWPQDKYCKGSSMMMFFMGAHNLHVVPNLCFLRHPKPFKVDVKPRSPFVDSLVMDALSGGD